FEAVIAVKTAHINVHETGAIEGSGHKIITCEGKNGKLYPSDVEEALARHVDEHMVKPKLVYISNSTEIGTFYTKKELTDLFNYCKSKDLLLFVDGARLGAALTATKNDLLPLNMGELCDAFYVGGAKNGLMSGEALVINHKDLSKDFRFHIKNKGAMSSKGYFLGIQFAEIFKDTLYFDLAKHSNEMAKDLYDKLRLFNLEVLPVETNQIFVTVKNDIVDRLVKDFGLEVWTRGEEKTVVRFVTSFATTKKDVDEVIKTVKEVL
ncbi:MAG: threonine aldolase, partial [Bacilli bacterium]|nr:threonine aldolase [Bacilli bacterium]